MKQFFRMIVYFHMLFMFLFLYADAACAIDDAQRYDNTSIIIDFSDNQMAYGEAVAEMNLRGENTVSVQSFPGEAEVRIGQLFPVLCRTYDEKFDFSPWQPAYILCGPHNRYTLYFSSEAAANAAAEELAELQEIRYAQIDATVEACALADYSFHSWAAEHMNYSTYLSYAAGCCTGGVTIAIIDSGVLKHPAYSARILQSGHDYIDNDDDATNDLFGHGTNVAGIVADCTQGFPVYLLPIRTLNANGSGSVSNTVNAICEATEKGTNIINLSLSTKSLQPALDDAVLEAYYAGVTVVIAAGNFSMDTANVSPANLSNFGILVVGACDAEGNIAGYSNFGGSVDIYVPGTAIECCSISGGYTSNTGTSMSAPHVSALAALLQLTHQGITSDEIETRIRNSTILSENVTIPDLTRITPDNPGFSLSLLKLFIQDSIQLDTMVRPVSAMETISYTSSDEAVLSVQNGKLIPVSAGTAKVTARCLGLQDITFDVMITEEQPEKLIIPHNVKIIEDEAFSGNETVMHVELSDNVEVLGENIFEDCNSLRTIIIPASVKSIGENSFSGAVVLCPENSAMGDYVVTNHLQYIFCDN